MAEIKEKIFFNRGEQALDALNELRRLQADFDKKKKALRKLQEETRSLSQKIPEKIRRWQI